MKFYNKETFKQEIKRRIEERMTDMTCYCSDWTADFFIENIFYHPITKHDANERGHFFERQAALFQYKVTVLFHAVIAEDCIDAVQHPVLWEIR